MPNFTEAQVLNAARCAGLDEQQWLRLKAYLPLEAADKTWAAAGTSYRVPERPPHAFSPAPNVVGCWQIGGKGALSIHVTKRPRWLTRRMCRLLLQWEWVDRTEETR